MITGAIISICVLYWSWDTFGEWYARKMGWKHKFTIKDRIRLINFEVQQEKNIMNKIFKRKKTYKQQKQTDNE